MFSCLPFLPCQGHPVQAIEDDHRVHRGPANTILQYARRFYSSQQRILSSLRIYYGRHGRFEHCKATSAAGSLAHNLLTVFLLPPHREEEDLFSGTIIPVLKQRGGIFPLGFLCSPIIWGRELTPLPPFWGESFALDMQLYQGDKSEGG